MPIAWIPGLIAIYMGWMSKTCYAKGDIDGANKKSASAKKWFYITIAVGLAAALYGAFSNLSQNGFSGLIHNIESHPFTYGLPK